MAETDNLDLKKRARRRLVGSVALALVAAVVLPMVMDREPTPSEQDVQIHIPRQDSPYSGKAPNGAAQPDAAAQPGNAPPDADLATPPVPLAGAQDGAEAAAGAAQDKPVKPPVKTEPKAEAKLEPKVVAKPLPRPEAPKPTPDRESAGAETARLSADAARAAALLEGRSVAANSPSTSESLVVQLGAYRDRANALALRDKLKAAGFPAYSETLGDKTRVRVGPFSSRDAAEQAMQRLAAKGYKGVVTPH